MEIKAVIFDLDGVIIHTDIYHFKAWKRITDKLGLPFDETVNDRLRGVSRMDSLDIILENAGAELALPEKEKLSTEKNGYYKEYLSELTPEQLSPEVLETLKLLRERGYKLAIGSSSRNAGMILEKLELMPYFDAVSDGNNITRSKPDPEVFLKAAEYLNVEPRCCVIVEDAEAGIIAGQNAGMKTIAFGGTIKPENADYTAASFADIAGVLCKI